MIKERSFWMYILLSVVTCGIYSIYFWYTYAEELNIICDGDGNNTQNYIIVILLSAVTLGIYYYFWIYSIGNRLAENAPRYNLSFEENGTTVLLWSILGSFLCGIGPLVGINILIKNFNRLAAAYN